jgi:hypothetical protein
MKYIFLKNYQDYCKTKESRNDIFKIQQLEDENLEDYMERIAYISQKSNTMTSQKMQLGLFSLREF